MAPEANELLVQANGALLTADAEAAIKAITTLAERVFAFYPFTPDPFPDNWRAILRRWLLGQPLAGIGRRSGGRCAAIHRGRPRLSPSVGDGGAPRSRRRERRRRRTFGLALDDYELGLAVPAVETGTMNRSASILIQAGFNSRLAAIKAVTDTGATFTTGQELRTWLRSPEVAAMVSPARLADPGDPSNVGRVHARICPTRQSHLG